MATYKEIESANKLTMPTDIRGKDYIMVNQRVKAFRMVYPDGLIQTEIVSLQDGVVMFKASVYDGLNHLLATGFAQEKETSSFINKTSYIENCETSAIGRALGFCGFGIDSSIASYEEVANAIENQENTSEATQNQNMAEVIWGIYKKYPKSATLKQYIKVAQETAGGLKLREMKEEDLKALKAIIDGSMKTIEEENDANKRSEGQNRGFANHQ